RAPPPAARPAPPPPRHRTPRPGTPRESSRGPSAQWQRVASQSPEGDGATPAVSVEASRAALSHGSGRSPHPWRVKFPGTVYLTEIGGAGERGSRREDDQGDRASAP